MGREMNTKIRAESKPAPSESRAGESRRLGIFAEEREGASVREAVSGCAARDKKLWIIWPPRLLKRRDCRPFLPLSLASTKPEDFRCVFPFHRFPVLVPPAACNSHFAATRFKQRPTTVFVSAGNIHAARAPCTNRANPDPTTLLFHEKNNRPSFRHESHPQRTRSNPQQCFPTGTSSWPWSAASSA